MGFCARVHPRNSWPFPPAFITWGRYLIQFDKTNTNTADC